MIKYLITTESHIIIFKKIVCNYKELYSHNFPLSQWTECMSLTFICIPSIFSFLFFQKQQQYQLQIYIHLLNTIPRQHVSVPSYRQKEQKLLLVGSQTDKEGFVGSFNKSKVKRRTAQFLPDRHDYVRM